MLDIPKMLKELRDFEGLTAKQISDRMGLKTRASYSCYELGYRDPTVQQLLRILEAMGYELELVVTKK
jgi:transcriptional regulator with XRE-family HTH domain